MSAFAGNGATGYRVSYSPVVLQSLKAMHAALRDKERPQFAAAARAIHARLRRDPQVFGEYQYPLVNMRLRIRSGAIRPLHVSYGLHDELPQVFVRRFLLLPGRDSVSP
jgi:hypothetical protein